MERKVKLNTLTARSRYVQKQHGCRGFIERRITPDRFLVRVAMADGCTGWFSLPATMLVFC